VDLEISLPIALLIVVIGIAYLSRERARRRGEMRAMLQASLARVASGEKGVRLEPAAWGESARQVSAFNVLAQEQECGVAGDVYSSIDRGASFRRLREEIAPTACLASGRTFIAIAEINRFATLRRGIGFKLANRLLQHVGKKIVANLDGCEIGRVGRTNLEFAFKAGSMDVALAALQRLASLLEQRIEIEGFTFDLPISIGFADASNHSIREELVDQAAAALAIAQATHQRVKYADQSGEIDAMFDDLSLMRDLPRAMRDGELQLFYQPKLRSRTNRVDSAEALLRWFHPSRGQIATDRLIELAESTGAIRDLTEWVIQQAVADQQNLVRTGHDVAIYVNISGVLLPDADFAEKALSIVARTPGRIGFEITETAVITDPDRALANLKAFAEAGVKIAIDDYGSGLSSLAYLKQLPANELKIDRMFVSGLINSHRDPLLVRSSIDLAHALEMEVTAEGVDDPMVLSLLRVMGCDLIQGFLVSPPLCYGDFSIFLADAAQLERLEAPQLSLPGQWPIAAAQPM